MSMVRLILSPLERRDDGEEAVCIGAWNEINEDAVAAYHWNDRDKLYSDHLLSIELYNRFLSRFTSSLNELHGIERPVEYWKLIIGPWLHGFICIVLDRYQTLLAATKGGSKYFINKPKYHVQDWIPVDYIEFNKQFVKDEWNYLLLLEIIENSMDVFLKETNYELIYKKNEPRGKAVNKFSIKNLLFQITRNVPDRLRKVVFVEVDIPQISLFRLLLRLKNFPVSYYMRVRTGAFQPCINTRSNLLNGYVSDSAVEEVLAELLPRHIPTAYVEGYREIKSNIDKYYPDSVDLVFTTSAHFSNEYFKIWVSEKRLQGARLFCAVHGGHHGTALFNGSGQISEEISDRYYTLGWGEYALSSPKLSRLKTMNVRAEGKNILFITYSLSRYSNHIDSSPISSTYSYCIDLHGRLFAGLESMGILENVMVRVKEGMYDWGLKRIYQGFGLEKFSNSNTSLIDDIKSSSIVIVTYDSTVFLETFVLNVPTLLFYKKEYWEMSEVSKQYFNKLKECGILHHDEVSLMEHYKSIENDIYEWWNSQSVQYAVSSFINMFGRVNDDWEAEWYKEISSFMAMKG